MSDTYEFKGYHQRGADTRAVSPGPGGEVHIRCTLLGTGRLASSVARDVLSCRIITRPGDTPVNITDLRYDTTYHFQLTFFYDQWRPAATWWQIGGRRHEKAFVAELHKAMQAFASALTQAWKEQGVEIASKTDDPYQLWVS